MAIIIEGLEGPHGGERKEFDNSKDKITFGRAPESDFVFPEQMNSISRFHMTLELIDDRYRLHMQMDNPVFVNGKEAASGDELDIGASTIHLGTMDGPSFKLHTKESHAHMPKTDEGYEKKKSATEIANLTRKRAMRAVAAIAIVVAVVVFFQYQQREEQRVLMAQISDSMTSFDSKIEELNAPEFSDVLGQLTSSVYVVAYKSDDEVIPGGTAWAVGPGVVATNAHVAEMFTDAHDSGYDLALVSNTAPYDILIIDRVMIHPHWGAFQAEIGDLITDDDQLLANNIVPAYDVALMWVTEPDKLAAPLILATAEELADLSAGDELGLIGYPMENVTGGVNVKQPVPTMQIGRATAITNYFLSNTGYENDHLIQKSIFSAGGASGSPVFNSAGHVVAAHNAGNYIFMEGGVRIPAAVGITYSQRSDLIRELIDNSVADIEPARMAYWADNLDNYRGFLEYFVDGWIGDNGLSNVRTVLEFEGALLYDDDLSQPAWQQSVSFDRVGHYLFIAVAGGREDIDIYLFDPESNLIGKDSELDHYPALRFSLDNADGRPHRIIVVGPSVGVEFEYKMMFAPG